MPKLVSAALALGLLAGTATAHAEDTVRFWYHFDNADNPMSELVAKFEQENPGIKIEAENIPWNSYYDNLYTSIVAGNAPDAAMVKMFAQPRLVEMGALEPIGDRIDAWDRKADLQDNLLILFRQELWRIFARNSCRYVRFRPMRRLHMTHAKIGIARASPGP